jgi:hypothetical protein
MKGAWSFSDYFLNEDNFGKVHAEGDHKIHVARIAENDLVLDPHFHLDFNTAFATGLPAHTVSPLSRGERQCNGGVAARRFAAA